MGNTPKYPRTCQLTSEASLNLVLRHTPQSPQGGARQESTPINKIQASNENLCKDMLIASVNHLKQSLPSTTTSSKPDKTKGI